MSQLIYKKMSDVMKDIGSIGKDQKNVAQGFKFRGIDQFVNSLYPALTKHGVFMCPRVVQATSEIREVERSSGKKSIDKHVNLLVEYDFFAEDGSKVTVGPIASEGVDSGDKATNKALSAALKYGLIQTFSIPTEDMVDGDSESPTISGTRITKALFVASAGAPLGEAIVGETAKAAFNTEPQIAGPKKVSFARKPQTTVPVKAVDTGDDI